MPSESGDMKLLGNFRKLIDLVSSENYNPSNVKLQPDRLQPRYEAAQQAVQVVLLRQAEYKERINERQAAYDALDPIVMRARNMLKASGADKQTLDNAETYVRKLLGRRKSPKAKTDDPAAPADPKTPAPKAANHSVSQLSFENRAGNFDAFIAVLVSAGYAPSEVPLRLESLQQISRGLKAKNDAVSSSFVHLSQARGQRDQLLYENEDCVINIALLVKAYVSAVSGTNSQVYKEIKGLEFRRAAK